MHSRARPSSSLLDNQDKEPEKKLSERVSDILGPPKNEIKNILNDEDGNHTLTLAQLIESDESEKENLDLSISETPRLPSRLSEKDTPNGTQTETFRIAAKSPKAAFNINIPVNNKNIGKDEVKPSPPKSPIVDDKKPEPSEEAGMVKRNSSMFLKRAITLANDNDVKPPTISKKEPTIINNNYNININVDKDLQKIIQGDDGKGIDVSVNNKIVHKSSNANRLLMNIKIEENKNQPTKLFSDKGGDSRKSVTDQADRRFEKSETMPASLPSSNYDENEPRRNSNIIKKSQLKKIDYDEKGPEITVPRIDMSHLTKETNKIANNMDNLKDKIKTSIIDKLTDHNSEEGENLESDEIDDAFDTITEEYLSEEEDEVNDLNNFDGSFLKEMLKETNRHYIKAQESNEEKIYKLSARIVKSSIILDL